MVFFRLFLADHHGKIKVSDLNGNNMDGFVESASIRPEVTCLAMGNLYLFNFITRPVLTITSIVLLIAFEPKKTPLNSHLGV